MNKISCEKKEGVKGAYNLIEEQVPSSSLTTLENTMDELKIIKKALPFQYAKLIANKLSDISPEQVRNVFSGEVTDPDIVLSVLEEARRLYELQKKISDTKKEFIDKLDKDKK